MIPPVHLTEAFPVDMGVYLRRADVGMAEKLLDGADIGAALKHVRREAVTQNVRRYPGSLDSRRRRTLPDDFEYPLPGERAAETGEKHMGL
jgi:hypothetical protein